MSTPMQVTIDHEEIRRWAEQRGGRPAIVTHEERGKDEAAVLRFEFPDTRGEESLTPLEWDTFFHKFEAMGLALMYQEALDEGLKSERYRFVARDAAGRAAREGT